jgi:outer membrane immunogenic protein
MKSALFAAVAMVVSAATPVLAAPRSPIAAPYSWTGWYAGANVGYGWGNADSDLAGNQQFLVTPPPNITVSTLPFANAQTVRTNGAIGGAQLGYNLKLNSVWVVGLEADLQGGASRGDGQFNNPLAVSCDASQGGVAGGIICGALVGNPHSVLTQYQAKIDWFGTVRGRVGFLQNDQLLVYATGGLAYGRVGVSGNTTLNSLFLVPTPATFAASRMNVGYALGAGIEGRLRALSPNWTWKLEYLYVDLGSLDAASVFQPARVVPSIGATVAVGTNTHFTNNVVRAGLNYQFR